MGRRRWVSGAPGQDVGLVMQGRALIPLRSFEGDDGCLSPGLAVNTVFRAGTQQGRGFQGI